MNNIINIVLAQFTTVIFSGYLVGMRKAPFFAIAAAQAALATALLLFCVSCNAKVFAPNAYENFAAACDLLEAGEYRAAIKKSKKAAALFKDFDAFENGETLYYDCQTFIGEAYLRMGDASRAQKQFEKTFDLAPQNEDMLLGIAAVYFRLQKYSEGKAFFESRIRKHKSNVAARAPLYHYYAVCLSAEGDWENAFFAAQVSMENYLRAGKEIPASVERFLENARVQLESGE